MTRCSSALVVLALCFGCSRVPWYARPQGGLLAAVPGDGDFIHYRMLTRADFKGGAPGGDAAAHADAIGAQTYALLSVDDFKITISGTTDADGATSYAGKSNRFVHFSASMDRRRSWWNPKLRAEPESYVLQHEQTHFAIFAAEARKLNDEAPELTRRLRATGDSEEEVRLAIQKKLDGIMRDAIAETNARNLEFDEDTSGRYEPKKQTEWFRKVTAELEKE